MVSIEIHFCESVMLTAQQPVILSEKSGKNSEIGKLVFWGWSKGFTFNVDTT